MLHLTVTCLNITFLLFHERLEISRKIFYPNKLRDFHARCVISYIWSHWRELPDLV